MNRRSGCAYILGITLLFNLFLALPWMIGLSHALRAPLTGPAKDREPFRSELNFTYQLAKGWASDDSARAALAANLALSRPEPKVWVVISARDVKFRELDAGELVEEGLKRFRTAFRAFAHEPPVESTLGGRPAWRIIFQGERQGELMSGELRAMQSRGYAYWVSSWCRANEVAIAAGEVAEAINRFALADDRPDWKPITRQFVGRKLDYTLEAAADLWRPAGFAAEQFDPTADLAIEGSEPGSTSAERRATLLVLLLPRDDEPLAAVRRHVLDRQREDYPDTTAEELSVERGERPMMFLKVLNAENRTRLIGFTAIRHGGQTVAVVGESGYSARSLWEREWRRIFAAITLPGRSAE